MTEKRFSIVKNELDFYFDVNDTEKRWEIGDVELDNLPVFEDLVDLLNDLNDGNEQFKQFKNLAIDYNVPFDKLCDVFEDVLNSDTVTTLETEIAELKAKVDDKAVAVETATEEQMLKVFTIIDEKILECEKAVEDIRYNGKDSYIVKHDVASKILKELKKELES